MSNSNPGQVLLSVWQNALLAFCRLPLLILGCLLLYTLLSGYWFHFLPFHVPGRFAGQSGYAVLHAIVFAPLVVGVMLTAVRADFRQNEIWTSAAISVGIVILIRDLFILICTQLLRAYRPLWGIRLAQLHYMGGEFAALVYILPSLIYVLALFLLSIRLVLLLPLVGLEREGWRIALSRAWRSMKGHYGFALIVSLAAILPVVIAEHFLNGFYRSILGSYLPDPQLTLREWAALMVRSTELALDDIMNAALAAGIYLAIVPSASPAAPPSDISRRIAPAS